PITIILFHGFEHRVQSAAGLTLEIPVFLERYPRGRRAANVQWLRGTHDCWHVCTSRRLSCRWRLSRSRRLCNPWRCLNSRDDRACFTGLMLPLPFEKHYAAAEGQEKNRADDRESKITSHVVDPRLGGKKLDGLD